MNRETLRNWLMLWLPWSGLAGGLLGWGLQHQAGTYLTNSDCAASGSVPVGLLGLCGAALALLGGWLSLRELLGTGASFDGSGAGTRRFIAALGAMSALLFLLTIVMQTLAGFVIPPCAR
jgi:hypothetical protein